MWPQHSRPPRRRMHFRPRHCAILCHRRHSRPNVPIIRTILIELFAGDRDLTDIDLGKGLLGGWRVGGDLASAGHAEAADTVGV